MKPSGAKRPRAFYFWHIRKDQVCRRPSSRFIRMDKGLGRASQEPNKRSPQPSFSALSGALLLVKCSTF